MCCRERHKAIREGQKKVREKSSPFCHLINNRQTPIKALGSSLQAHTHTHTQTHNIFPAYRHTQTPVLAYSDPTNNTTPVLARSDLANNKNTTPAVDCCHMAA